MVTKQLTFSEFLTTGRELLAEIQGYLGANYKKNIIVTKRLNSSVAWDPIIKEAGDLSICILYHAI
jgi:hypothetical protein